MCNKNFKITAITWFLLALRLGDEFDADIWDSIRSFMDVGVVLTPP